MYRRVESDIAYSSHRPCREECNQTTSKQQSQSPKRLRHPTASYIHPRCRPNLSCELELSAATFPIVSDDTDFRHAYKTIHIEPQDGFTGPPLEKYSFEVKFKPNPNDDNVTDILYMEVNGSTNKIIKINSGEREVI